MRRTFLDCLRGLRCEQPGARAADRERAGELCVVRSADDGLRPHRGRGRVVAAAHGVSWPTVQRAVVAHGLVELVEPEPVGVLGMDETRFGRPRWLPDGHHDDGRMRWQRTDPWETGFVDITGEQALLGQVDGRTSAGWPPAPRSSGPRFRWW
jgi:hypothetical protein